MYKLIIYISFTRCYLEEFQSHNSRAFSQTVEYALHLKSFTNFITSACDQLR